MANGEVRNEKYMVSRADVSRVPPQTGGVSGTGHARGCLRGGFSERGVSPRQGPSGIESRLIAKIICELLKHRSSAILLAIIHHRHRRLPPSFPFFSSEPPFTIHHPLSIVSTIHRPCPYQRPYPQPKPHPYTHPYTHPCRMPRAVIFAGFIKR